MTLRLGLWAGVALVGGCLSCAAAEGPRAADPSDPLYALPYAPGAEFLVGQGYFEFPTHERQYALDWTMPEETPIHAARAGVVIEAIASFSKSGLTEEMKSKCNRLVIQHDDGTCAMYVHLAQDGILVQVGQRVQEGQKIALSGNTGFSATPHLHFMVYRLEGGQAASLPTLFKSGGDQPYAIVRGGKYRAPGGDPVADDGPLKGIKGTGELSSIRPRLVALVRAAPDPETAVTQLKRHLLKNREQYKKVYRETFARSRNGDRQAMRELQDFLNGMDLQSQPEIARLVIDPSTEGTANEALLVWWDLFAQP